MSGEQSHLLLDELVRATDEMELKILIERSLTKVDHDFSSWLADRVNELREADTEGASRLAAIWRLIDRLAETGHYRKDQFDEDNPANPKEGLLSLARRVARG